MLTWKMVLAGVWIQDHSHVQANTHTALRCVHPDIIIDDMLPRQGNSTKACRKLEDP